VDLNDKVLNLEQAMELLHQARRWFFKNAERLPFIKRASRKHLLISD